MSTHSACMYYIIESSKCAVTIRVSFCRGGMTDEYGITLNTVLSFIYMQYKQKIYIHVHVYHIKSIKVYSIVNYVTTFAIENLFV